MADRVLFIGWSAPIPGREERGLEVFNEALGLYGRMQQEGRIESFDVVLLNPSTELNGYMQLHGSHDQLAAAQEDEEFRRMLVDASLAVANLRVVEGITDQGISDEIAIYQDAISKVPQAT